MEPSFNSGNYLIIDEISYRFREPVRGEVVVFRYPGDPSTFYIKRIIGLPKEGVEIRVDDKLEGEAVGITLGQVGDMSIDEIENLVETHCDL